MNKIILVTLFLLCSIGLYAGERYELVGVYNVGDSDSASPRMVIYDKLEKKFIKIYLKDVKVIYGKINPEKGKYSSWGGNTVLNPELEKILEDIFGDGYFGIPKPTPVPTVDETKPKEAKEDKTEKYDWE